MYILTRENKTFPKNPGIMLKGGYGFWCVTNFPQQWSRIKIWKTKRGAEKALAKLMSLYHPIENHRKHQVQKYENVLPY